MQGPSERHADKSGLFHADKGMDQLFPNDMMSSGSKQVCGRKQHKYGLLNVLFYTKQYF